MHFESTVQRKEVVEACVLTGVPGSLLDVVAAAQGGSRTDARRLILNGAVKVDGVVCMGIHEAMSGVLIRIGKRIVVRVG